MSELKATPGPWIAVNNGIYFEIREENGMNQIGDSCASRHVFDNGDNTTKGKAANNAQLMAAAPELYESNQELARHVIELCSVMGVPLPQASVDRHLAASSKARGDQS